MMTYVRNYRSCDLGSLKKIGRLSEFWVSRHTVGGPYHEDASLENQVAGGCRFSLMC